MKLFYGNILGLFLVGFMFNNCSQVIEQSPMDINKNITPANVSFNNSKDETQYLIKNLEEKEWRGAVAVMSPLSWDFNFTEPMYEIIDIGNPAQDELLKEINNPKIKDQIIVLLGGIGDAKAVEPIINAMIAKAALQKTPNAEKINSSANIALTNLTVANVIWHHGGGIVKTEPPPNSKKLWKDWWRKNKATFKVEKITQSRNYSNYPNYGIYKNRR